MSHITEIKIDGLLGRTSPIQMTLNRQTNIFFGENGCGKTTLLKILDAALNLDGATMSSLPVDRAEVHIYSIKHDRVIKHVWEKNSKNTSSNALNNLLEFNPSNVDSAYLSSLLIKDKLTNSNHWKLIPDINRKSNNIVRWAHTFLPTTRLYISENRFKNPLERRNSNLDEQQLDRAFADSVNRAWLQFYSKTLMKVRQIQEEGLRAVLRYVLNPEVPIEGENSSNTDDIYRRVENFLSRQNKLDAISLGSKSNFKLRYREDENLRRVVDNLDNVERRIENTMLSINKFTWTVKHLFSRGKSIALKDDELQILLENGNSISLENLSSGEKHLIKILLSAMTAEESSVLIDEPELSMHIDWQRTFVETIHSLNPSCQLLLASHSPEIMADVQDDCIFRL